MIKKLTKDDIVNAYDVAILKPIRGEKTKFISKKVVEQLINDTSNVALGLFNENKLISWSVVKFSELDGELAWFILFYFTSDFKTHFNFNNTDFKKMVDFYFIEAEARQCYSYFYSVPESTHNIYYKKWSTAKGRYRTFNVEYVPANTLPSKEWMARLNGGVRNYDSVIKKRTLKNEYRNNTSFNSN